MTELHLYIAEDGTEFEDEQECLAYEAAQSAKTLKEKFVLLYENFKVISLDNLADWERTFFIFTKDVSALHELREVCDWYLTGMCPPSFLFEDKAGLFAYDEDKDDWYHMGTRLQEIQSTADKAMKTVNDNL